MYGCSSFDVSRFPGDLRAKGGMVGGAGIVRMGIQEAWPLTSWPHPFHPIQSYCLKVKEMDDEEYSCIVSTEGAQAGIGRAWGAHTAPSEGSSIL